MRIVALLAAYNEARFIGRVIRHLAEQGVESYVIDNDSTDGTRAIAERLVGRGVIGVERLRRRRVFKWQRLLRRKEELHRELGADWYLHDDPDMLYDAPPPHRTLAEGIAAVDRAGDTAIDFDEFIFLPTNPEESYDHERYVEEMEFYCYFAPKPLYRVNAWKNFGQPIDLATSGGHAVRFEGRRVHPERFILRHYLALSHEHAVRKYCTRRYDRWEVRSGFHAERAWLRPEDIRFPDRALMKRRARDGSWDRSEPWTREPLFLDVRIPAPRPPGPWRRFLTRHPLLCRRLSRTRVLWRLAS